MITITQKELSEFCEKAAVAASNEAAKYILDSDSAVIAVGDAVRSLLSPPTPFGCKCWFYVPEYKTWLRNTECQHKQAASLEPDALFCDRCGAKKV